MPARRDWTPDALAARLVKEREQARLRMARWRLRQHVTRTESAVTVTPIDGEAAVTPTPSPPPPPLPALSTTERLLERLAPFASRAFKPDPAFLALLAERYPGVDLELELAAALDWLEEPRHAKRRCSKGFLANWVKKADADRKAREQAPPPPSRRELVLQGQPYQQPQSLQPNRHPDAPRLLNGDLQPIERDDFSRYVAERRRLPLEQRVAQWRGGGT